jgi:predicted acetyltransferase
MEGKIGAGAVLYRNGRLKAKLQHQLETIKHHTVYKGEGVGILLGLKMISNEWGIWLVNIYIDNQAAIAAISLTKPNSGHYIFDMIQREVEMLQ